MRPSLSLQLRRVRRNPLLAVHHFATVAFGLAAVTAVVSLASALLFRPLPFRDSTQLVEVWNRIDSGAPIGALSGAEVLELQNAPDSLFESAGGFTVFNWWLLPDRGSADAVTIARLDAAAFYALDVIPLLGRRPGAGASVMSGIEPIWISSRLWRARFGGRLSAIGETIRVAQNTNGLYATRFEIAGVLPAGLTLPHPTGAKAVDLWSVLPEATKARAVRARVFFGLARLRSPHTEAEAQAALAVGADHRPRVEDRRDRPVVQSFEEMTRGPARRTMALFVMGIGLVLVLAFANLANLTVAETSRRQAELSIRAALGADRWRLWRDLAAEQLALTASALTLGVPLAWAALRLLTHVVVVGDTAWNFPRSPMLDISVMVPFSISAVAASVAWSAVIVRRVEARGSVGLPSAAALSGPSTVGRIARRTTLWRHGILAFQACLGMALMVLALSVTRTYVQLTSADLGRAPQKTVFFAWHRIQAGTLTDAEAANLDEQVLNRLRRLPQIEAIALAEMFPPASFPMPFRERGDIDTVSRETNMPLIVSDDYFATVGIPILFGRRFTLEDRYGGEPVAIVDLEMARRNWPSPRDAVDAKIEIGTSGATYKVIGVAASFNGYWTRTAIPTMYLSLNQSPIAQGVVIARAATPPATVVEQARQALRDAPLPLEISAATSLQAAWEATATRPRARMRGALLLALIGLALGAQGVHALVASIAASRRRELAIRSALGACRPALLWLMLRPVLTAVGVGAGAAVLGIAAVQRMAPYWISSALSHPTGPIAAAGTLLVATASLGAYLPARNIVRTTAIAALSRADL